VGEPSLDLDILLVAVGAQALVAFGEILGLQRIGIEAEIVGGRNSLERHDIASSRF